MKRVFWLTNLPLSKGGEVSTGTWLSSLATCLVDSGMVEIGCISCSNVETVIKDDSPLIEQWLLPFSGVDFWGLPKQKVRLEILRIITEFQPDIIHIWGTEYYWATLSSELSNIAPVLLDIQGLIHSYIPFYFGYLSFSERIKCIGFRELLRPLDSVFGQYLHFRRWGGYEVKMIQAQKYISVQSHWVNNRVQLVNTSSKLFSTDIILRNEFYQAKPWSIDVYNNEIPLIFASSAWPNPYKGMHVLIKALALLKIDFPKIKLRIVGHFKNDFKTLGYSKWLFKLVERHSLVENVEWLGNQDGMSIISLLQESAVSVFPSCVETYGVALCESMIIGVPSVVSYSGAMPEISPPNSGSIFFTPGDEVDCYAKISSLLNSKDLMKKMSVGARLLALERHSREKIVDNQLAIYDYILSNG